MRCAIARGGMVEIKLSPPGQDRAMEFWIPDIAVSLARGDHPYYDAFSAVNYMRGRVARVQMFTMPAPGRVILCATAHLDVAEVGFSPRE